MQRALDNAHGQHGSPAVYASRPERITAIFALLVFLTAAIVLPTNGLAGIPVKMGTTGVLFLYLLSRLRYAAASFRTLRTQAVALLIGCGFILAFMLVAVDQGQVAQEYILAEGRGLAVMLLVAILVSVYQPLTGTSARAIVGCLIAAIAVYAVIKLTVCLAIAIGLVPSFVVRVAVNRIFDYDVVMSRIYGPFVRMQFPSDMLAVLCSVFLLPGMPPGLRIWWPIRVVLGVLFLGVAVTGWSRLLMTAIVVLPLGTLLLRFPRRTLQISAFVCGIAAVSWLLWGGSSIGIVDLLGERFFGRQTVWSDDLRAEQIPALLDMFDRAPLFGHGVGSFAPAVIRDHLAPFNYEAQLVAVLMKFGIAGTAILAFGALWLTRSFLVAIRRPYSFVVAGQFGLLLAASLTNPYLESSMSGILIGCLLAVAAAGGERPEPSRAIGRLTEEFTA